MCYLPDCTQQANTSSNFHVTLMLHVLLSCADKLALILALASDKLDKKPPSSVHTVICQADRSEVFVIWRKTHDSSAEQPVNNYNKQKPTQTAQNCSHGNRYKQSGFQTVSLDSVNSRVNLTVLRKVPMCTKEDTLQTSVNTSASSN